MRPGPTNSKVHQVANYIDSQLSKWKQIFIPSAEEKSLCVLTFLFSLLFSVSARTSCPLQVRTNGTGNVQKLSHLHVVGRNEKCTEPWKTVYRFQLNSLSFTTECSHYTSRHSSQEMILKDICNVHSSFIIVTLPC